MSKPLLLSSPFASRQDPDPLFLPDLQRREGLVPEARNLLGTHTQPGKQGSEPIDRGPLWDKRGIGSTGVPMQVSVKCPEHVLGHGVCMSGCGVQGEGAVSAPWASG